MVEGEVDEDGASARCLLDPGPFPRRRWRFHLYLHFYFYPRSDRIGSAEGWDGRDQISGGKGDQGKRDHRWFHGRTLVVLRGRRIRRIGRTRGTLTTATLTTATTPDADPLTLPVLGEHALGLALEHALRSLGLPLLVAEHALPLVLADARGFLRWLGVLGVLVAVLVVLLPFVILVVIVVIAMIVIGDILGVGDCTAGDDKLLVWIPPAAVVLMIDRGGRRTDGGGGGRKYGVGCGIRHDYCCYCCRCRCRWWWWNIVISAEGEEK